MSEEEGHREERIFDSCTFDRELIARIYLGLTPPPTPTNKRTSDPLKNGP